MVTFIKQQPDTLNNERNETGHTAEQRLDTSGIVVPTVNIAPLTPIPNLLSPNIGAYIKHRDYIEEMENNAPALDSGPDLRKQATDDFFQRQLGERLIPKATTHVERLIINRSGSSSTMAPGL